MLDHRTFTDNAAVICTLHLKKTMAWTLNNVTTHKLTDETNFRHFVYHKSCRSKVMTTWKPQILLNMSVRYFLSALWIDVQFKFQWYWTYGTGPANSSFVASIFHYLLAQWVCHTACLQVFSFLPWYWIQVVSE